VEALNDVVYTPEAIGGND